MAARLLSASRCLLPRTIALSALSASYCAYSSSLSSSPVDSPKFVRVALCQVPVTPNKTHNIQVAREYIRKAVANGAQIVMLPEIWNSPYATSAFPMYAESIPDVGGLEHSESCSMLSAEAKRGNILLIGGSIPERSKKGEVFNTCPVFDSKGVLIAKHRKMHLFDIDIPGKITFKESDTLTAGKDVTVFDSPYGKIGLGICYDLRFHQLSTLMREQGVSILAYPGAFNMTTGPLHWEALSRARAIDHQCYVLMASPARSTDKESYQAWGHSTVVDPWGKISATTEHEAGIVFADIDLHQVDEVRRNIPISHQKRNDVYEIKHLSK